MIRRARRSRHDSRTETFGALLQRYLARQRAKLKPRSYVETERHLLINAKPLHSRAVKSIDRRTIAALLSEIADSSGPYAANRVRASLSTYFMWLTREGLFEANVVANTTALRRMGPDHVCSRTRSCEISGRQRGRSLWQRRPNADVDRRTA